MGALERDPHSLFAGIPPPGAEAASPLEELTPLETTLADYRSTGLTTGPHVMAHLRPALAQRGVLSARELRDAPNGRFVRVAGHVIVRQRPGSAKGFCFVTLEDETGTLNGVFTPDQFERLRGPLHAAPLLEIAGPVQSGGRRDPRTRARGAAARCATPGRGARIPRLPLAGRIPFRAGDVRPPKPLGHAGDGWQPVVRGIQALARRARPVSRRFCLRP